MHISIRQIQGQQHVQNDSSLPQEVNNNSPISTTIKARYETEFKVTLYC